MKYLTSEERSQNALKTWSQGKSLIVARHFFWNAGTPMQKSYQGLLQTILSQILSQHAEYIPIICKDRWEACEEHSILQWDALTRSNQVRHLQWSTKELSHTLELLVNLSPNKLSLCILIDGLDEYDGDHEEIVRLILKLADSSSVKICKFLGFLHIHLSDSTNQQVRRFEQAMERLPKWLF